MAQRHYVQNVLAPFLWPISKAYSFFMRVRAVWQKPYRPEIPCISVGNISWGGTGKSPIVDDILFWAEAKGLEGAVLTRGYGVKIKESLHITSDGQGIGIHGNTGLLPDEALMLARRHKSRIIADPDRVRGAHFAQNFPEGSPDFFLLDDGFQHMRMGRHRDIVLLDKDDMAPVRFFSRQTNWNRVLPLGTWREGVSALKRADVFLMKCSPREWEFSVKKDTISRMAPYSCPFFVFTMQATGLRNSVTGELLPPEKLSAEPYALTCGVGNPGQVQQTAEEYIGHSPLRVLLVPDHDDFSRLKPEITRLASQYPVICTEKDAVKLGSIPGLYVLQAAPYFYDSLNTSDSWHQWLEKIF